MFNFYLRKSETLYVLNHVLNIKKIFFGTFCPCVCLSECPIWIQHPEIVNIFNQMSNLEALKGAFFQDQKLHVLIFHVLIKNKECISYYLHSRMMYWLHVSIENLRTSAVYTVTVPKKVVLIKKYMSHYSHSIKINELWLFEM